MIFGNFEWISKNIEMLNSYDDSIKRNLILKIEWILFIPRSECQILKSKINWFLFNSCIDLANFWSPNMPNKYRHRSFKPGGAFLNQVGASVSIWWAWSAPPPPQCVELDLRWQFCVGQYMSWNIFVIKVLNIFWYFEHPILTMICLEAYLKNDWRNCLWKEVKKYIFWRKFLQWYYKYASEEVQVNIWCL